MELIALAILYTVKGVTHLQCVAYVMGGPNPEKAACERAFGELRKKHGREFKLKRVMPITVDKTHLVMVLKASGIIGVKPKDAPKLPVVDYRALVAADKEQITEHDQTDLGASDDRPLGPDSSLYRQG